MDLSAHNNFEVSCAAADEITFSNQTVGQSGNIFFDKTGSAQPTVNAIVAINASSLTALATAGVYHLTYYVKAASGNNSILVSVSGVLS